MTNTEPAKLNLGSGSFKKEGFVNVDWQASMEPDVVHDLNVFPYPFPDNRFDYIEAIHVLEHLDRPFSVMKELHRILRPGGELVIKVPHFSRGFTHAEHMHGFDITFPLYFRKESGVALSGYQGFEFESLKTELHWLAFMRYLPLFGFARSTIALLGAVNFVISGLANLSPTSCSRIWCFWVGGFEEVEYRFKARK